MFSSGCLGSWPSFAGHRNGLAHRVEDELPTQVGEDVRFRFLERRLHGRRHWTLASGGSLSKELPPLISLTFLPDHAPGTEVTDKQTEKICLGRGICGTLAMYLVPDIEPRTAGCLEDRPDNCKMGLVVEVEPVDEQADHIIGAEARPRGI